MSVKATVMVSVSADRPFRLESVSDKGLHWFYIQGYPLELTVFAKQGHPEAHRLEAAVAAFNAVMDAKEESK